MSKRSPCLVERYTPLVSRLALRYQRLAGGAISVEDLVQVGLVDLAKAVAAFDPARGVSLPGYARPRIARAIEHHITDQRRTIRVPAEKQRAAWRRGKPYPLNLPSLDAPAPGNSDGDPLLHTLAAECDPTDELDAARQRQRIADALEQLPERWRNVVVARFYADQSCSEAGAELGISRQRVRQIELQALARLRDLLGAP